MFEIISISTAFIGSILAALFDLKTTEIPDEIPYAMIVIALVIYGVQSLIQWNYWPLLDSISVGLILLAFGFVMYYLGQWGGGDAKILSAIGFLIPKLPTSFAKELMFPFPVSYLINVFFVGAAYMLMYAFIIALINKKIFSKFFKDIKASSRLLSIGSAVLFIMFLFLNWSLINYFGVDFDIFIVIKNSVLPLITTISLFIIWKFAKTVEDVGFKKKIPISKLKVGDVLLESKLWEGITQKELNKIRKSGKKSVVVKEGVRFAMAFPLALFFSLYFGDGLLLFMKVLI